MKLLLIDDHPLFGLGFAHALASARAGVEVRTALTLDEGLAQAAAWPALELVLIDYRLAGEDGLTGLRRFGSRFPLLARVLISGEDPRGLAAQARAAGAAACLCKNLGAAALLDALDEVAQGGECFRWPPAPVHASAGAPTARQLEVLALLAQGRQNKQIADDLGIAERTVKLHVTALLDALHARNRTHLLVRARELGLV